MKEIGKLLGIDTTTLEDENILELIKGKLSQVPYVPFPTAFHTVDVIATRANGMKNEILLGKKPDAIKWVFIGGFMEPMESAEAAALREFGEEAKVIITDESRLRYIGSSFADDSRFMGCHKITTSIFTLRLQHHEVDAVKGGDDIVEVKWFPLDEVYENLSQHHKPLFVKYLINKK